jgi:hypothetical protein
MRSSFASEYDPVGMDDVVVESLSPAMPLESDDDEVIPGEGLPAWAAEEYAIASLEKISKSLGVDCADLLAENITNLAKGGPEKGGAYTSVDLAKTRRRRSRAARVSGLFNEPEDAPEIHTEDISVGNSVDKDCARATDDISGTKP